MEVQAKLQIGTRLTSSSRPNTDALCEHIALTLVAPNMEDLSLYEWYISGEPLNGRVVLDLSDGQTSADGKDMKLEFEDAYCYAIEEEYRIDAMMRRTVKLSIVANEVTFEGATFKNPYINEK